VLSDADANSSDLAAVVSHRFWLDRLGGGPIAGRVLRISNRTVSIVGVLPDDFRGPGGLYAPDVWLPVEQMRALNLPPRLLNGRWLGAFARIADGASIPQAHGELAALSAHVAGVERLQRETAGTFDFRFYPMSEGHPELRAIGRFVWMAMTIVGLVLLIACFNVAALLLARAAERQQEIAIRTALGASRLRIVRQLVTEGLVLALFSGAAAVIAASWSNRLLASFSLPAPIPQRLPMAIDRRLVMFTAGLVLVAGVLPGLLPALQATRRSLVRTMKLGASLADVRTSRTRNMFVGAQITASTLFLAVAILFVRSFWNASAVDPGFDVPHVVVAELQPSLYGYEGPRARALAEQLVDRLSSSRDVAAVAVADRVPFYVGFPKTDRITGQPVTVYAVGRRHFDALGIPLRAGRDFSAAEQQSGTAVIVSEAVAAREWRGASAVGRTIRLEHSGRTLAVIGVAADVKHHELGEAPRQIIYTAIKDADFADGFTLIARATGDPQPLVNAVRNALHSAAPGLPVASIETMQERLKLPLWPRRTAAAFFLICGVLALILATVGLFGATYYAVRQRTREFGIRMAIGARSRDVVHQVLREGLRLSLPAAALGLLLTAIAGRLIARLLLGVSPADPVSYIEAAAIETVVALLACALPARQATQSDPITALRSE
jgi:predicted permease